MPAPAPRNTADLAKMDPHQLQNLLTQLDHAHQELLPQAQQERDGLATELAELKNEVAELRARDALLASLVNTLVELAHHPLVRPVLVEAARRAAQKAAEAATHLEHLQS